MLPFWEITEKFIGGAMPATPSYSNIIHQQQIYLNNNGYDIDYESNWITPWDGITDREYTQYYWANDPSYSYLVSDHIEYRSHLDRVQMPIHEINKVKAKLEQYFADPNMKRVVTHNIWGEYGHAHHRAMNKASRELAVKYRKDLWMLGCDNGVFLDIDVPPGIPYTIADFDDIDLYLGIRTIYENYGRWTWNTDPDRIPSGEHKFIKIVDGGIDRTHILSGESVTSPGPYQNEPGSYIFDGNDDYMTLRGNNNASFTILMRVMPAQIREMDISAMSEYPTSGKNDRNIYLNSEGRVIARINDGSSKVVTSSTRISASSWTHIAISGNGSNLKLYINGTLERQITAGTAITNYSTPELILGQAIQTGSYFRGQISDVRMYNRVLSDNEIAQISGKGYTLTSSAGTGGTISPSGSIAVGTGSDFSFNIRANSGYRIADVRVDNVSVGAVTSYSFSNISNDHSISASFQRTTFSISAQAEAGGNIDPEGEISVNYGSNHSFSVEPEPGYQISDVRVDNVSVGAVSEYFFNNITTSHTISALFTPIIYNIESKNGQGGSINPLGVISILYGHDQSYSITPARGFQVEDVLVDNNSVGSVTNYSFRNVTSDHSITAEFKPITYTIAGISGPGGSISPAGTTSILYGHDQSYSFTPEKGFKIVDVTVDNVSVGAVSSYSFRDITSDHSVLVEFAPITYTIAGSSGPGGHISPEGEIEVNYGNDQQYYIIPDYGYKVSNVIVDYHPVYVTSNEFSFNSVERNHTISVTFSKMQVYVLKTGYCINGSISPAKDTSVFEGSDLSYSIVPSPGYRIYSVFIDSTIIGPVSGYTFNNISADHNISATFSSLVEPDIYPNPFRNEFRLTIRSPYDYKYDISILTLGNRIVYMNQAIPANTTITLAPEIPPGFYILNIYYKGRIAAFARIVKN